MGARGGVAQVSCYTPSHLLVHITMCDSHIIIKQAGAYGIKLMRKYIKLTNCDNNIISATI